MLNSRAAPKVACRDLTELPDQKLPAAYLRATTFRFPKTVAFVKKLAGRTPGSEP